jgi:hypothetical protein
MALELIKEREENHAWDFVDGFSGNCSTMVAGLYL